jgi:hypothetical protein
MKRAVLIFVAALLVLLIYPSTHPLAVSPGYGIKGGPSIISSQSDTPPIDTTESGDGDDGDADGVAGVRGTKEELQNSEGARLAQPRVMLFFKMWWNFMIWIR